MQSSGNVSRCVASPPSKEPAPRPRPSWPKSARVRPTLRPRTAKFEPSRLWLGQAGPHSSPRIPNYHTPYLPKVAPNLQNVHLIGGRTALVAKPPWISRPYMQRIVLNNFWQLPWKLRRYKIYFEQIFFIAKPWASNQISDRFHEVFTAANLLWVCLELTWWLFAINSWGSIRYIQQQQQH